ncbi:fimbria/pilus outer membrane usher protein [Klebsiella pasteurii]|uniref:fimbria/pilus outer membrane usher protein n=1 Tax=Klebsiella pasteurii TaxID=2587529 RepID=UPI00237B9611|nr:fimbria/pilus outer membrane usher protein [Klebsiella pasteurii]MDD9665737.1 fimbrial biogenesis outer membrane usher protein [Klebsiella pasteurii]MDD9671478.1 fimbrial biogenesis outer membrane usher protein [Klebsiella pasteurii]MDD9687506.1 fimbrial biogenesis outer membrane usher protein [Klebsiella pasteurii]
MDTITKSHTSGRFSRSRLALLVTCQIAMLMGGAELANAAGYFNPALLEIDNPDQGSADLSVFEEGELQPPGTYRVDIYLNGSEVDTRDVKFFLATDASGKQSLQSCLSGEQLRDMGVKIGMYPGIAAADECANFTGAIDQSSASFRFDQQRLNLSIPQAALNSQARGYVSPDKWDAGIPALLMNYSFSGANTEARNNDSKGSDTYYLNLRSGANLGAWRLRNYSTWNRDSRGNEHWDSINTYLQRDIHVLRSQLTLGDSNSPADIFDSVPFRGAQLSSDDDMLPDSLKGYSPVVRGIARSNAQVTIRQNGYVIYQSYVPAGSFAISDLYPTAGSGDLNVTIKEADGSEQTMVVPFASVPVLQREGRLKYSITSGQYRSYNNDVEKTLFTQGTAIFGLPHGATIYGGVQAASKYQSLAIGLGQNLGAIGALSADITQAWSRQEHQDKDNGQSYRLRYGKSFVQTGTNFSLASYRYSTSGFYTLQEALESYAGENGYYNDHKKSRAELTLSQNLWQKAGSLSVSVVKEEYWNNNRSTESASVGYNNTWNGISYGLNYTYSRNGVDSHQNRTYYTDRIVAVNVSVPLSKWLPGSYATYNLNSSKNGNTSQSVGLSGTALPDDNLNYSISQGFASQGEEANGYASADYKGGYGEVNVGYGYDHSQSRVDYGLQGGILVHENGVTLSQPLSETMALVKAPGAGDVSIANNTGVKTDWRGYAVVPYVTAYRRNQIALDTSTLPDNVDMTLTSTSVIPTRGAVVRADFDPNVGQRVLMTLTRANGEPVPFGATAGSDGKNSGASIVGDGGQVYLSGMADSGTLTLKWGSSADQTCQVNYRLPEQTATSGIQLMNGDCR